MISAVMEYVHIAILVLAMVMSVAALLILYGVLATPIVEPASDKTALVASNAVYGTPTELSAERGSDVLMSLLATDEQTPYPRSVRINDTPIIDLNTLWLSDKYNNISRIYNSTGDWKIVNMLDWYVTDVTYVYDSVEGDYIKYTLKEVI